MRYGQQENNSPTAAAKMTEHNTECLLPSECLTTTWGCEDNWSWNRRDKSHEVRLYGPKLRTAHFHPNWSNGTAGVRGTRVLNRGCYYWQIKVSQRIFGTSMMFGIGTKKARLHVNAFVNMLGEDDQSWGLSHKGLLWHNGEWRHYTKPFRENEATTIGILFDGHRGTMAYYKDGFCLGVAFTGLHLVQDELYPVVCSTAAKTEMSLSTMRREFYSLQDRCRAVIIRSVHEDNGVQRLELPNRLKAYLGDEMNGGSSNGNEVIVKKTSTGNQTSNPPGFHFKNNVANANCPASESRSENIRNSCLFV